MIGITMAQWINLFGTTDSYCRRQLHSLLRKIGHVHIAEPDLTAGRQMSDEIQVNLEILNNHCTSKYLPFCSF